MTWFVSGRAHPLGNIQLQHQDKNKNKPKSKKGSNLFGRQSGNAAYDDDMLPQDNTGGKIPHPPPPPPL